MDKVKAYSDVPWYDKSLTTSDEDLYKARDSRDFVVRRRSSKTIRSLPNT